MTFDFNVDDGMVTAVITGRLDSIGALNFEKQMQPLLDNAAGDIILDCSELEYICSSGLRHFITLRKRVQQEGGTMAIRGMSDNIRRIFDITGLTQFFDFIK